MSGILCFTHVLRSCVRLVRHNTVGAARTAMRDRRGATAAGRQTLCRVWQVWLASPPRTFKSFPSVTPNYLHQAL